MCADIGDRECRTELGNEHFDGEHGVMPASVAPAKDINLLALKFAEDRRMALPLLRREAVLF